MFFLLFFIRLSVANLYVETKMVSFFSVTVHNMQKFLCDLVKKEKYRGSETYINCKMNLGTTIKSTLKRVGNYFHPNFKLHMHIPTYWRIWSRPQSWGIIDDPRQNK
jgi:hypothetical protein